MLRTKHALRVVLWPPSLQASVLAEQQQEQQQQQQEDGMDVGEKGGQAAAPHDVLLIAQDAILPLLYRCVQFCGVVLL
jgi:hypothetical protein